MSKPEYTHAQTNTLSAQTKQDLFPFYICSPSVAGCLFMGIFQTARLKQIIVCHLMTDDQKVKQTRQHYKQQKPALQVWQEKPWGAFVLSVGTCNVLHQYLYFLQILVYKVKKNPFSQYVINCISLVCVQSSVVLSILQQPMTEV